MTGQETARSCENEPKRETYKERAARFKDAEDDARRTPGHVFAICENCGESWMAHPAPVECRRCAKATVVYSGPCPGCDTCQVSSPGLRSGGDS